MNNTTEPAAIDTPTDLATSPDIKAATQELLKYGHLEADRKPNIYKVALTYSAEINEILQPLEFILQIDEVRGLLFLSISEKQGNSDAEQVSEDEQTHPLVRRQRLTLEQSLLVAILRQHYLVFEQESGVGIGNASISVEEVTASVQVYLEATGSETRDEKRTRALLENLKGHNIVTEIDEHDRVDIRPLIAHVANPASLAALLSHYQLLANPPTDSNATEL